jgi:hypothetical protein
VLDRYFTVPENVFRIVQPSSNPFEESFKHLRLISSPCEFRHLRPCWFSSLQLHIAPKHCTIADAIRGPIDPHSIRCRCVLRMAPYLCLSDNDNVSLRQNDCAPKSPSQRLSLRVGCRFKPRQPLISSNSLHGAKWEDGPPLSSTSTSRIGRVKQVTPHKPSSRKSADTTPFLEDSNNDLIHRRSLIIRTKALGSKQKVFSCRDLELTMSSDVSLPSSSASNHDDPYGHSESSSGSMSLKSVCPKIPPSINDSPHRSNSRRRAASQGGASTEGVRRPSSVRRFSRREPLSPLTVSVGRGRQRSSRRLEMAEDPRSHLEMHLNHSLSRRSADRSREKYPTTDRDRDGAYKVSSSQEPCMSQQRRRSSGSEVRGTALECVTRSLPDQAAGRRPKGDVPSIGHLPFAPNL